MKANITIGEGGNSVITILDDDGQVHTVTEDHVNFHRITKAVVDKEPFAKWGHLLEEVPELVLNDERLAVDEAGTISFEDEPIDDGLAHTMKRYQREGREDGNIVRFLERLKENPSKRGRSELFQWVQARDLTIDPEGYFIGYKGVKEDFHSLSSGAAYVTGIVAIDSPTVVKELVTGQIPNFVGNTVEMDRYDIDDDSRIACSDGLHIGNFAYANGFGAVTLEVRIDPKDVVTVPDGDKLRCCKYTVLAVHEEPEDDLEVYEPPATTTPATLAPEIEATLQDEVPKGILKSFIASFRRKNNRRY